MPGQSCSESGPNDKAALLPGKNWREPEPELIISST